MDQSRNESRNANNVLVANNDRKFLEFFFI